jgi:NADH oxidase (H2O2-forming)
MNKTDVLIIGGGPAGVVAATTAKKTYPSKKVSLIRKDEKSIIPCGIPYIFHRLSSVDDNLMSDKSLKDNDVELIIQEVTDIKHQEKKVILKNKTVYEYEKLILALGSQSHLIPIPGIDKKGVWLVKKNYEYLKELRQAVLESKNIVIIGGGFIGIEFAEELSNLENKNVSIVEILNHCLITNFDEGFTVPLEDKLKKQGVKIFTGQKVTQIGGNGEVQHVELNNGEKIPADLVILSIGAKPNITLAQKAGIQINEQGGIEVDQYLKTNLTDIFAVGDCAQTKDLITEKDIPIMLASVATTEARIAASNLYQLNIFRENKGTVGVFSTRIYNTIVGSCGLTEKRAQREGIEYIIGEAQAPNHHPAKLAKTEIIKVKLIFSKTSDNLLLGGEIMGPESISEMPNILAMALQQKASLCDFNTWQIATHPLLTSAPTVYPLIVAAHNAMLKLNTEKNDKKMVS